MLRHVEDFIPGLKAKRLRQEQEAERARQLRERVCQLMEAIFDCDTDQVCTLLDEGLPVDCRDNDGYTALMMAAMHGCLEIVRHMLDRGAQVDAKKTPNERNPSEPTALMLACESSAENLDVIRTLL